ncbi:MAG: 6-carboxytetrahydropterin synthase QueD [Myxococcota bacterium]
MPTEIERRFRFEAAHRLPHVPPGHKCARLHGHSFYVTIRVRGPVDDEFGWVMDFAELDEAFKPLHAMLDHRYLNEVEGLENPTSEHIARFIAERIQIPAPAKLSSVTLEETCVARVVFFPE